MFNFLLLIIVIVTALVLVMPRLLATHHNAEKAAERGVATLYEANDKIE